jgi:copper chaperone
MKEITTLNVTGMSCQHCVNSIKKAVGGLGGVTEVDVFLESKRVIVSYDSGVVPLDTIIEAITDQGYEVQCYETTGVA